MLYYTCADWVCGPDVQEYFWVDAHSQAQEESDQSAVLKWAYEWFQAQNCTDDKWGSECAFNVNVKIWKRSRDSQTLSGEAISV